MGYYYQSQTGANREEDRHRAADAVVAASLIASQTLLSEVENNDGQIPTFSAEQTPPLGRKVHEMTMETADGGREEIDISYTMLGSLDQINIDRDGDGEVDSKFVTKSELFGNSEVLYYADADGELTARGIYDRGFNPFEREVRQIDFEKPDGEPIGSIQIENTFFAQPGLFHVMRDGQEVATGHVKKGQFKEILSIGNGESPLQYRLKV